MHPILKKLQNAVFDRIIMKRVIGKGIQIIRTRTGKGEYLEGSSPGADKYSEEPVGVPLLAYGKGTANKLMNLSKDSDEVKLYKNKKTGGLWALVMGGYKEIRELAGKNTDKASMNWSGKVLRDLKELSVEPTEGVIGFTDERSKKIAIYQQVMGAGKSKKKKVFVGFSDEEVKQLSGLAGEEIAKNIAAKLR